MSASVPPTSPCVFISHAHEDFAFVETLANDLERQRLSVFVDRRELGVGDSIVDAINRGLTDSDYVLAVLSQASVESAWVKRELAAALWKELSVAGTVVMIARLDDTPLPPLLADKVYADFRGSYQTGLAELANVLSHERPPELQRGPPATSCAQGLEQLSRADLRRRICRRLSRTQVRAVWHALFETDMEDDLPREELLGCVLQLMIRAQREDKFALLHHELCEDFPDLDGTRSPTGAARGGASQASGGVTLGDGAVNVNGDVHGSVVTGQQINTQGGAYIGGSVNVGGNLIGRDKLERDDD